MRSTTISSRQLVTVLSVGNFVIGMGAFVVIGVLSPIATGLNMDPAEAGLVMSVYALTYALSSPLLIAYSGAVDRRNVLSFGLLLFLFGAVLSALAPTPLILFAARALAACGAGLFSPVAAGVVVAVVAPERRGKELSKVFLGLTVAQVLGVPVGSYLGYSVGWQAAFWAVASLSVVVLALLRRFVPAGLPSQVTSLSLLGAALRDPPRLFAAGFTGAFLGSMYVVYTYLAPMLEQTLGFGRDGVTLFLVLFGFGAVAGNLLGGYLNDHIGAYRTLVILCVAQAVLMPSLSLFPVSLPVAGLLVFTWSLAGWSFMAPQQVRLVTLAPHHQNIILALHASFIYLGASVGSAIGGAVLVRFGIGALGAAGGVCAMLTLLQLVVSQRWASAK